MISGTAYLYLGQKNKEDLCDILSLHFLFYSSMKQESQRVQEQYKCIYFTKMHYLQIHNKPSVQAEVQLRVWICVLSRQKIALC